MADPAVGQADVKLEKDPVLADINQRVLDAFDIFDHDGNKTVDVRLATLELLGGCVAMVMSIAEKWAL